MTTYTIKNIENTLETITTERKIVFISLAMENDGYNGKINIDKAHKIIGHYIGAIDLLDFQLSINK